MRLVCRGLSPRAGDTIPAFSLSLLYYPLRHVEGLESRYVLRYASYQLPTLGAHGCWRKEGDWYLVGIVPIHLNHIHILFCCVKCL